MDCLETVRPTTVQENNAIEVADAFISGLISGLKVRYPDTKFGSCR